MVESWLGDYLYDYIHHTLWSCIIIEITTQMDETRYEVFYIIHTTNKYTSLNHVNQWVEVKHGRHHMVTGQLCKSLIDVRETTDDVDGS